MKVSVYLALKNMYRNKRYSLGLFAAYLIVSVLCITFFLFSSVTKDDYNAILNRQASSSYVSISFSYSEHELFDLTEEQLSVIKSIPNIGYLEKCAYTFGAKNLSVDQSDFVHIDVTIISSQNQNLSPSYKNEFSTITDENVLVCGREVDANSSYKECLLSSAFVTYLGANTANDLLGKKIVLTDATDKTIANDLTVVGILHESLSNLSDMEGNSKYFVFTGIHSIEKTSIGVYYYKLYSDYTNLSLIQESIDSLSIDHANTSLGNNNYATRKLSDTIDFISAILILIALLCIGTCIAFISSSAVLRFLRSQTFYTAAFAVGLSKHKLALCFLIEFLVAAAIAYIFAIPMAIGVVELLSCLIYTFVGIKSSVAIPILPLLISIVPIVLSAGISLCFVRRRFNRVSLDNRS